MINKKNKKNIIYFDPFYDEKYGHYYNFTIDKCKRFQKAFNSQIYFITTDDRNNFPYKISKLLIKTNKKTLKNIGSSLIKLKGLKKFNFLLTLIFYYIRAIKKINSLNAEYVIYGSTGNIIFWFLSLILLKKKYLLIVISLYNHENNNIFFKSIFSFFSFKFFNSAELIFCLEETFKNKLKKFGLSKIYLLQERSLIDRTKKSEISITNPQKIKIVSIGTLSEFKNNFNDIESLFEISSNNKMVSYEIYGKFSDYENVIKKYKTLKKHKSFIHDIYLSEDKFIREIIKADIIFFPYKKNYLENMTSGILYNVFQFRKFILCPNHPIFEYYIKNFKIGRIFNNKNDLKKIINEFHFLNSNLNSELENGYNNLFEKFSEEKQNKNLRNILKNL